MGRGGKGAEKKVFDKFAKIYSDNHCFILLILFETLPIVGKIVKMCLLCNRVKPKNI